MDGLLGVLFPGDERYIQSETALATKEALALGSCHFVRFTLGVARDS